jgi:hypothetical protein
MPVPVSELDAALDELRQLYAQLDAELAAEAVGCQRCGRCCNFHQNPYILFASWLERALIDRATREPAGLHDDGSCGWQRDGLCTIHEVRPLGCRTAFCRADWGQRQQELHERYRGRLIAICSRLDLPWDYRPLLVWFRSP